MSEMHVEGFIAYSWVSKHGTFGKSSVQRYITMKINWQEIWEWMKRNCKVVFNAYKFKKRIGYVGTEKLSPPYIDNLN